MVKEYIIMLDPRDGRSAHEIESIAIASGDYRRLFDGSIAVYSDKDIEGIRARVLSIIGRQKTYLICESASVVAEGDI